jgi:hypothetical protein
MILDKERLRKNGYDKEIDMIKNGICPCCKNKVDSTDYDEFHLMEFELCGYCKNCTDLMFDIAKEHKDKNLCAKCEKEIIPSSFTKPIHKKMYDNCGVCPICQDKLINKYEKGKENENK